jgi:hypothetical protein
MPAATFIRALFWTLVLLGGSGDALLLAMTVAPFTNGTASAMAFFMLGSGVAGVLAGLALLSFGVAPRPVWSALGSCLRRWGATPWASFGLVMALSFLTEVVGRPLPLDGAVKFRGLCALGATTLVCSIALMWVSVRRRRG